MVRRRPYWDLRLWVIYPTMVFTAFALITFLVAYAPTWPEEGVPVLAVGGAVFVLLWAVSRQGLYVTARGVRIQGIARATTIEWSKIAAVDDGLTRHRSSGVIGLLLVDGTYQSTGIQRSDAVLDRYGPFVRKRQYEGLVDKLSARVAMLGGSRSETGKEP
jgi:hypothetical protein